MAHITTVQVSEETTKLMDGLGFRQISAISPNIQWSSSSGVRFQHLAHETPKDVESVIRLVYTSGYNEGTFQQIDVTSKKLVALVQEVVKTSRINYVSHLDKLLATY